MTITYQIFNNSYDNKNIYHDLNCKECLDYCVQCYDLLIYYISSSYTVCDYNCHKNKEKSTLVLDIQEKRFSPTAYAYNFWEYIENRGDRNVF